MTQPEASLGDYVVIDRGEDRGGNARTDAAIRSLKQAGWRQAIAISGIEVFVSPNCRLETAQVHRRHILIGVWRGAGVFLSSLAGGHRSPTALAQAVVTQGWGRYIFLWRGDDGCLQVLRDPSGGLDCVCWNRDGVGFVTNHPPTALDVVLPAQLAVDWPVVSEISETLNLAFDRLALEGLEGVLPGRLASIGHRVTQTAIWTPVGYCTGRSHWDEDPASLRTIIDDTVSALTGPHQRLLSEISGGLDSAIVTSSLVASGAADKSDFLTFFDDQPEGDERIFARAAATKLGVELTEVYKPIAALSRAQLNHLGQRVRPGFHGLDAAYDADVATRAAACGATGLLTGQGGDAVFFQSADPLVVIDRFRREGPLALNPRYLGSIARWTRHSVWTIARYAVFQKRAERSAGRRHAWMRDAEDLPPAKARQIQQIANCQMFWGDCLRTDAAELLHPLLSQPVVEHCLAIPTDRLTQGGRDRALARLSFSDRLPQLVTERRDKGDLSRFYAHVVRGSAPALIDILGEGRLMAEGVISPSDLTEALSDNRLVWDPAATRFLVLAVLELWIQHWEARIHRAGRVQVLVEPGDDALV